MMEGFWKEAVKVTGSVAVVGVILVVTIKSIFQDSVLNIFGSEKTFYISIFILGFLAVALILSLVINAKKQQNNSGGNNAESRTVSIDKSRITGDIVLGDKTTNQDRKP